MDNSQLTNDQILQMYGVGVTPEKPGFISSNLKKGFATAGQAVGGALRFAGADELGKTTADYWKQRQQEYEAADPSMKLGDISGVGDAAKYVGANVLQMAPVSIMSMVPGGVLGRGAALAGMGANAVKGAAIAGGGLGALGTETGIITSEVDPNKELDRTQIMKGAIPAAAAEFGSELVGLGRTGIGNKLVKALGKEAIGESVETGVKAATKPLWQRAGKTAGDLATIGLTEGMTESAQSPLEAWGAGKQVFKEGRSFEDAPLTNIAGALSGGMVGGENYTPEMQSEMLESFGAGAAGGFGMGAGGKAVSATIDQLTKPKVVDDKTSTDMTSGNSVDNDIADRINAERNMYPLQPDMQDSIFTNIVGETAPSLGTPNVDPIAEAGEQKLASISAGFKTATDIVKATTSLEKEIATAQDGLKSVAKFPELAGNVPALEQQIQIAQYALGKLQEQYGSRLPEILKNVQEFGIQGHEFDPNSPLDSTYAGMTETIDPNDPYSYTYTDQQGNPTELSNEQMTLPFGEDTYADREQRVREARAAEPAYQAQKEETEATEAEQTAAKIAADSAKTELPSFLETPDTTVVEESTAPKAPEEVVPKAAPAEVPISEPAAEATPARKKRGFGGVAIPTTVEEAEAVAPTTETTPESKIIGTSKGHSTKMNAGKEKKRLLGEHPTAEIEERDGRFYIVSKGKVSTSTSRATNSDKVISQVIESVHKLTGGKVDLEFVNGNIERRDKAGNKRVLSGETLGNLVRITQDATDIKEIARHEVIHALRNMGLFNNAEWKILEAKANKWVKDFNLKANYPNLTKEELLEEGIAHAFENPSVPQDTFLKRIKDFLESLWNLVRNRGFQTAEDVLGKVESGEIGNRPWDGTIHDDLSKPALRVVAFREQTSTLLNRLFENSPLGNTPTVDSKNTVMGIGPSEHKITYRAISEVSFEDFLKNFEQAYTKQSFDRVLAGLKDGVLLPATSAEKGGKSGKARAFAALALYKKAFNTLVEESKKATPDTKFKTSISIGYKENKITTVSKLREYSEKLSKHVDSAFDAAASGKFMRMLHHINELEAMGISSARGMYNREALIKGFTFYHFGDVSETMLPEYMMFIDPNVYRAKDVLATGYDRQVESYLGASIVNKDYKEESKQAIINSPVIQELYAQISGAKPLTMINLGSSPEFRTPAGMYLVRTLHRLGVIKVHESIGLPLAKGANRKNVTALPQVLDDERGTHKEILEGLSEVSDEAGVNEIAEDAGGIEDTTEQSDQEDRALERESTGVRDAYGIIEQSDYEDMGGTSSDESPNLERNRVADTKGQTDVVPTRTEGIDLTKPSKDTFVIILDPTKFGVSAKRNWRKTLKGKDLRAEFKAAMKDFEQNGDREALLKTYTSVLLSTWDRLQSIEADPKANKRYAKLTEQVNASKLAKESLSELLSKVGVPVRGNALKTLFENLDVIWHRHKYADGEGSDISVRRDRAAKEIAKYLKNRSARNITEASQYIWRKLEEDTRFFGDSMGTPVPEGKEAIDYQRTLNSFMAQHAIFGDDKFSEVYFINDDIRVLKARNGDVQAPVGHSFALSYLARRAYLDAGSQRKHNKENSLSKAAQLAAIHASKYGVYPFTINDTYTIDTILTHLMSEELSASEKRKTKIVIDKDEQNRINKFVVEMMYQNNQANLKKLFGEAKESGKAPTKLLTDTGETKEYVRMPIPAVAKRVRDLINMIFNGDPGVAIPAENQLMRFLDRIEDGLVYSDFIVSKYQEFLRELDKDLHAKSKMETALVSEMAKASKLQGPAKSLAQINIDAKRKELRQISNPKKYMVALTKVLRESVTGGTMIDIPNKWKMAPTASFNINEYETDWKKLSDAEKEEVKTLLIPAIMDSLKKSWGFSDSDLAYKVVTNQDTGVTSVFFWQGSSVERKASSEIRTMNKDIKEGGSLTSRIKFGKALEDVDVITIEDRLLETLAEQGGLYKEPISRTDDGKERLAVVPRAEAGDEAEYETLDVDFKEPERFPKFGTKGIDSGEITAQIEAELIKHINELFSKPEMSEDELLARKVLKELYTQLGMEDKLYGYDEIDTFDISSQPIKKQVSIDINRVSRPNDFKRNLGDAMYNLPWEEQRQFMSEERRAALAEDRDYDKRIERAAERTISAIDNFIHGYTLDKTTGTYKTGPTGVIGRQQGLGAFKLYKDKNGKLYSATLSDRKIKGQYMVKYKEYGRMNAAEVLVTQSDFERRFTPHTLSEKGISSVFDATGKIGEITLAQESDNYMNAIAAVKDEKLQEALDSFFINPLEDDKTSISTKIADFTKGVAKEVADKSDAEAKTIWNTKFGGLVKTLSSMPFDAESLAVRWTKFDIISKAMEKASEEAQLDFVNAAIAKVTEAAAGKVDMKQRLKEKAEARIKQQWANPTIVDEVEAVLQKLEDAGFVTSSIPVNMEDNKYYKRIEQIEQILNNEKGMTEERRKDLLAQRDRLMIQYKESTKGGRTSYIGRKYMITPKFAKMLVTSASYDLADSGVTTKAKYADMVYSNLAPFMNADGTPKAKNEMIRNAKKLFGNIKENKLWLAIKNIFRVPYFQAERIFKHFGSEAALNMLRESNLVKHGQELWKHETAKIYSKFKTEFAQDLSKEDFDKVNKFINWLDAFQKIPTYDEARSKFGIDKHQYDTVIQFGKDNQKHFVEFMRFAGANSYLIKFETLFNIPGLVDKINSSIGSKMGTLSDKEARELGRSITPTEITDKGWQRKFRASVQGYNDFMKTTKANMGSTVFYMPRIRKIGKYVVVGKDAKGVKIAHAYFDDVASAEEFKSKLIAKDSSIFEYKTPPNGAITAIVEPTPDNQYGLFSTMDSAQEYQHMLEAFDAEDAYKYQTPWFGNSALESGDVGSAHVYKRRNEELILGYNTDNFMDNYEQGLGRIAMSFARMDYGQKQLAHLAKMKIDSVGKSGMLPYLEEFKQHLIHDLKRPNASERLGGEVKKLTAFYYMGWSFLGGLVNATQPFVVGAPELARVYGGDDYTKNTGRAIQDIYKWTGFAAKNYMKFVREEKGKDAKWFEKGIATLFKNTEDNAKLPKTHAEALEKYSKSGLLNSMINDITFKNSLDDHYMSDSKIDGFIEQSLNIFGVTEVINREGSFLAAFDHYYKQSNDAEYAYKMADQFVSGTQYIVNKFNMPLSFKNMPSGVGTAVYALMSYPFNMLNQMYKHAYGMTVDKDINSLKVVLGIVAMTFMLGGFNGLPFKDLMGLLWKMLGHHAVKGATGNLDVDMKRMLNTVAPEEIHRLFLGGIPTLAGVNISKNIGMQTPFVSMLTGDKTAAEAVSGASGGLVKRGYDFAIAAGNLDFGKAFESATPEFMARGARALRMYNEGQLSPAGKSRTSGGVPIKETGVEAIGAALGVKSDRWADIQEDRGGERDLKDKLKRMKDAAQKAIILEHDYKPMHRYNQYITTKGLLGIAQPIKRIDMTPDKNLTKFQMAERNRKMDLGV